MGGTVPTRLCMFEQKGTAQTYFFFYIELFYSVFLSADDINTCGKILQCIIHFDMSAYEVTTYCVDVNNGLPIVMMGFDV